MHVDDELWDALNEQRRLIDQQRREIDALTRKKWSGVPASRMTLAVAAILCALAVTGVVAATASATGPVAENVVHGCFDAKTHVITVAQSSACPSGAIRLDWNQYTKIGAIAPLSVMPGVRGSVPRISLSGVVSIAHGGTGSSSRDFVDLSSAQMIAGYKTFTQPIAGSITGNAATVTKGLYTTGSYADPSWLTSLAGSKIAGAIAGNAGTVTDGLYSTGSYSDPSWLTSIAGSKVSGNIAGSAGSVTNGLYSTGSYSNPGWLTSLAGSKIVGNIGGNAGTVTDGLYSTGSYVNPAWLNSLAGAKVTGTVASAQNFTSPLGGDVTGTQNETVVGALQGVPIASTTPTADQGLSFDGTQWSPTTNYSPLDLATLHWNPDNAYTYGTSAPGPEGLAFDGVHMWVADSGSNKVDELDSFGNILKSVTVGNQPYDIAYDGMSTLAVTNFGGSTVSFISLTGSPAVSKTINVGGGPEGICFDGRDYWVANEGDGTVSEITTTGAVPRIVPVGNAPEGVACDNSGHVWVTNSSDDTVSEIQSSNGRVINTIPTNDDPVAVAFDGSHVWVADNAGDCVDEIADTASPVVVATIPTGIGPQGLAFDGEHIWVTDNGASSVTEIDVASRKVVRTLTTGAGPFGVAFDGSHIWVTNATDGDISKL